MHSWKIDTPGLFSIFPYHIGMGMKSIWMSRCCIQASWQRFGQRRSPWWGLFHAALTSAWGMGCLKPECRQREAQTQDDSRDFPEEEHQFEMALRIRSWLRGFKIRHVPFLWGNKWLPSFPKSLRAENLNLLLFKGSRLTAVSSKYPYETVVLLSSQGYFKTYIQPYMGEKSSLQCFLCKSIYFRVVIYVPYSRSVKRWTFTAVIFFCPFSPPLQSF